MATYISGTAIPSRSIEDLNLRSKVVIWEKWPDSYLVTSFGQLIQSGWFSKGSVLQHDFPWTMVHVATIKMLDYLKILLRKN